MQDPEVLARVIPGCESLEKIGPDEYRMKMKMALASLSGAFEGKVQITNRRRPIVFVWWWKGPDIGFRKATGC
jgi:carbon monoxide dehydrogenase subunit G